MKKQNTLYIIIGIIFVFGITVIYSLNKINTEVSNMSRLILSMEEPFDEKITYFGMEVVHFRSKKVGDAYDITINKSEIYNYIPFIFATVTTTGITIIYVVAYKLLNSKRR